MPPLTDATLGSMVRHELARTSFKLPPLVTHLSEPTSLNPFLPSTDETTHQSGLENTVKFIPSTRGTVQPHVGLESTVNFRPGTNNTVKPRSGPSGTVKPHSGTGGTAKPPPTSVSDNSGTGGTVKPPPTPITFTPDRLGKFASDAAALLSNGMSFSALCSAHRGCSSLVDPVHLPHLAAPQLSQLRIDGAAVGQSTDNWSADQLNRALHRGPHLSTRGKETFLREEFADMVSVGHWLVVPYICVNHLPNLRLSPTGLIPQKERRDRIIVDYSFYGINDATTSTAPDSLQFGHAFQRFLTRLHRADTRRGPIYLSKTDIADAFMQIWLHLQSIPILAALIPICNNESPLVAFPLVLPMGWVHSPNYLCSVTETICDITNTTFRTGTLITTPHRLTELANTPPTLLATAFPPTDVPRVITRGPLQAPLNYADVYMDDFLLASQLSEFLRTTTRGTLFHHIDSLLRPLAPTDITGRKEPNSVSKLRKGDAAHELMQDYATTMLQGGDYTLLLHPSPHPPSAP